MLVRLTLMVMLSLAATGAMAQDNRWRQAARCADTQDRAICWLRQMTASPLVTSDPDLARAPAVLAAAGLVRTAPDTAPEPDAPSEFGFFFGAMKQAVSAVRSGAPAGEVIALVRTLPVSDAPFLANPLQDQTLSFGRLDAYSLLSTDEIAQPGSALQDALLSAWEEDLPPALDDVINGGPEALAHSLVKRGDRSGAERVLRRLSPDNEPKAVQEMIRHGLLDAADDMARRATVENRRAGLVRSEDAAQRRTAAYFERMQPEFDAMMARAMAELSEEDRALLAAEFEAEEPEPAEDLGAVAAIEVNQARIEVMWAADRAGRDDLSRPMATDLFEAGLAGDDENALAGLTASLTVLVKPDSPGSEGRMAVAEARLETLAGEGARFPLRAVHAGWMRLGRSDRADAVLERWRPLAERQARAFRNGVQTAWDGSGLDLAYDLVAILIERDQVSEAEALGLMAPTQPIDHDINRGLGISRLEERLAGRSRSDQIQILIACAGRSRERRAWTDAETCANRLVELAETPPVQLTAAELLLPVAEEAARTGDAERAEALLIRALEIGGPAAETEDVRARFTYQLDAAIVSVSKALLRKDGRLQPSDQPLPGS